MPKYFLFIKNGTFSEKCASPESFDSITGELVNITFKKSEHGEIIKLHIVNDDDFYMLSLFINSRPAYAFLMCASTINLNLPFTINIRTKAGKDFLELYQEGERLPWGCNYAGFITMEINDRIKLLTARLYKDVFPCLETKPNPYPDHHVYKPMVKGDMAKHCVPYHATR